MPRTLVTRSPISEGISRRFFEALNALEALGLINSQEAFCNSNKLSPPRYRAMRLQFGVTPKPGYVSAYRNIEVETLYALVFLPAKAKNDVLSTQKDKYYAGNSGLDTDKDGKITKNELASKVQSYYA